MSCGEVVRERGSRAEGEIELKEWMVSGGVRGVGKESEGRVIGKLRY